MKSTSEYIADEIMDTIERERRINRDDLILAVGRAIAKHDRALKEANPIMVVEPQVYNTGVTPVVTTWGEALISPHVHTFTLPKDNTLTGASAVSVVTSETTCPDPQTITVDRMFDGWVRRAGGPWMKV
jgi:hypothetical protein